MIKYVEVFWTPLTSNPINDWNKILFLAPKPFYPFLQKHREGSSYLKCPAMVETTRNDFVILSPFDLEIKTNTVGDLATDRFGQSFFEENVIARKGEFVQGQPIMASLPPRYAFFCKEDVEMEIRDLPLVVNESNKNFRLIGGRFNISKWHRPVDMSVEFIDPEQPIKLRAEDGLYLVRFITPNNVPVKLVRMQDDEIVKSMQACTAVKSFRPGLSLKKSYELAADYIAAFWARRKGKI